MYASGRPTNVLPLRARIPGGGPYVIVADGALQGNDALGGGQVTIDRSDLAGPRRLDAARPGDRIRRARGQTPGGGEERPGLTLTGTRIESGSRRGDPRLVKSARRRSWRPGPIGASRGHDPPARGPEEAAAAFAWGAKDSVRRARFSTLNTDPGRLPGTRSPDVSAHEARAFGHAYSTSKKRSSKREKLPTTSARGQLDRR